MKASEGHNVDVVKDKYVFILAKNLKFNSI